MEAYRNIRPEELRCVELGHGTSRAWICPGMGGNCLRLSIGGAELLRTPESFERLCAAPCVYGTPILLPPNRIADGRFTWRNQTYLLPVNEPGRNNHIHGFLADAPFVVAARRTRSDADEIELCYGSALDSRYASQGLLFQLEIRYALGADGLRQTILLKNGDKPLPLGLGQHTALRAPFLPGGIAEDARLRVDAREQWTINRERIHPTGEHADTPLAQALRKGLTTPCVQPLSALFTLGEGGMELRDRAKGAAVRYEVEGYPFMMLWNQDTSREFVCCEPQTWLVNAPHISLPPAQTGFFPLEPYEERVYRTRLSLGV